MQNSKLKILYIVILVMIIAVMIVLLIKEPTNTKLLAKGAVLIVGYVCAIAGVKLKRSPLAETVQKASCEAQYRDIIGDAFMDDRKSRKALLKAVTLYTDNRYDEAVAALDRLRMKCVSRRDHSAVLFFQAKCFSERELYRDAIRTYEELAQYDGQNSRVWSNLGLCYVNAGRTDLAEEAYHKAIELNDKNPYAYTNYASLLLSEGKNEEALENAEKALAINAVLEPALFLAMQANSRMEKKDAANAYFERYRLARRNPESDIAALK